MNAEMKKNRQGINYQELSKINHPETKTKTNSLVTIKNS